MNELTFDKKTTIVSDFYTGFEGHPEYKFIALYPAKAKVFRMWEGWFDQIMYEISSKNESWTSIAAVFHLGEGWYDDSPWHLVFVEPAIAQFQESYEQLQFEMTKEICRGLILFLSNEHEKGASIFIAYD